VADERYLKYLGISPVGETATYYELLDLTPSALDEGGEEALEAAYKTQIRKLQAIRTSKDVGWIDYHKETLRTARRTLKDPAKRKKYDESLSAGAEQEFKDFVLPLLALGQLSTSMIEAVLLPKAKKDGLPEDRARAIIEGLAAENDVEIGAESDPLEESYDEEDEYEDGYDDGYDDSPGAPAAGGEVILKPSPGWKPPVAEEPSESFEKSAMGAPPPAAVTDPPWIMAEDESDAMPWGRGGSFSWGAAREESRRDRTADLVDESWLDEESRKALEEAITLFNHGARLAKVGADVHRNMRQYFPPANGKNVATPKIRGVSFEKLFETERKTYVDTLKAFRDSQERIGDLQTQRAEELRQRGGKNIGLVMGYIEEMKRHKMNLMGGLSTQETLRTWQGFVGSRRSPRFHKMMQELASA
jgi:hypothetical protein